MKKFNFLVFSLVFLALMAFIASKPLKQFQYMASYKKTKKMPLESRIQGRAEERANQLRNVVTGKVEPNDWYQAMSEIEKMSGNQLSSRGEELNWENQGPNQVGGRTRGFIFDKTKEGRVYCAGVSGGMFVSENLGHNWKPVKNMPDIFKIMPIGCMTQSKDGDIYVGTGEYWGNVPNGSFGSQFNGNGIYKLKAGEDEFEHLTSTISGNILNPEAPQFRRVIDIACDPTNNDIIFAGTDAGMQVSKDGGATWSKSTNLNGVIAQVEFSKDGSLIYAATNGKVWKSTNGGTTFQDMIGNRSEYVADGNRHVRIAISDSNANKIYACGIDNKPGGDLKYVILSEDGGNTWELIGRSDPSLSVLCSSGAGGNCQGFYDLCLTVHPRDDKKIFLGGSIKSYSWSRSTGWVQATNWTGPANLGVNLVHADKHEYAFHPTRPDTMVVCTDGGPYITYNALSGFPAPNWKPIFTGLNITQFYDMAVNKYGELVGGTQDNGTQFITLTGGNNNIALEISGGDGFDCAISAANDYQTAYTTVYNGSVSRTTDLTTARKPLAAGCVEEGGNFTSVGFHTRLGLVESIKQEDGKDVVDKSFLFIFNDPGQYTISANAHIPSQPTAFTNWEASGIGEIYGIHSTRDMGAVYICGVGGVRKNTTLATAPEFTVDPAVAPSNQPCLRRPNLAWTTLTGIGNNIGGIYVHQSNPNYVVATQFGFGGTAKVYLSTNGTSFTAKQGNLPIMPVYTCAIDPDDEKHVVVGTEFGIWETEDISAPTPVWREANKNIGRVPVFKLRVNYINKEECTMLYAGSHGRGFWRAPFPFKSTCDYRKYARTTSSIEFVNNIRMKFEAYPNPTTDKLNISFESRQNANYTINLYDMVGRNVKSLSYRAISGDNIVTMDLSSLNNGKYIVRVEDGKNVIAGGNILKN